MLSWLDCRWFHAAGGGHPCEHRGSPAAGRNCTGAKEKQPRQGCSPGELDVPLRKEMRAGCAVHWLLPAQLVLLSTRDCTPLLLGDLCMNLEGKGMGDELQVFQAQGLLISSKKSSSLPGYFFNECAF